MLVKTIVIQLAQHLLMPITILVAILGWNQWKEEYYHHGFMEY